VSDILCTFPGKFGDALWALPTVRAISELTGQKVDYYLMPYYETLMPLLKCQEYIDVPGVIGNWVRTHSNFGDQPWKAPEGITLQRVGDREVIEKKYKQIWHLGYRAHPGVTAPDMALIDFIAYQQGIQLSQPIVPFLEVDDDVEGVAVQTSFSGGSFMQVVRKNNLVAYAFNEQYGQTKDLFFRALWLEMQDTGLEFFNLNHAVWKEAAWIQKNSLAFVGDRSACWVMATGLGKKTITYEPHPARHPRGRLGRVFGCPYGQETSLPFGLPPAECAKVAKSLLLKIKEQEDAKYDDIHAPLETV
jgi:hypothetical protein